MTSSTDPAGAGRADKKSAGIGKGTPGPGRGKGNPNRFTREFRETIQQLLDDNADNVAKWLSDVAEGTQRVVEGKVIGTPGDPARALDLLARLAEFAAPKLGRTELVGSVATTTTISSMTPAEYEAIARKVLSEV